MRQAVVIILRRLVVAGALMGACVLWTYAAFAQGFGVGGGAAWSDAGVAVPAAKVDGALGEVTRQREALPLGARVEGARDDGAGGGSDAGRTSDSRVGGGVIEPASMWRTLGALGAVLALIVGLAWVTRKVAGKAGGSMLGGVLGGARAPSGVLEVLARYPVCSGTSLVLLKLDRRVLLVSQSVTRGMRSGATMQTLCELAEPEDVASILLKIRGEEQAQQAKRFESILAREEAITDRALEEVERVDRAGRSGGKDARAKHPGTGTAAGHVVQAGKQAATTMQVPADAQRSGWEAAAAIKQRMDAAERGQREGGGGGRAGRGANFVAMLGLVVALGASMLASGQALAQSRIGPPLPDGVGPTPSTVPARVETRATTGRVARDVLDVGAATSGTLGEFGTVAPGAVDAIAGINPLRVLGSVGDQLPGGRVDGAPGAGRGRDGGGGGGGGLSTAINILVVLTVISLAPSIMLMTTCFVRIMIVLGLLRQALGTTSIPPAQVITAMALFMTLLVMSPTLDRINREAIAPYRAGQVTNPDELWDRAKQPMRDYMFAQIDASSNWNSVYMVLEYRGVDVSAPERLTRADVDMVTLVPAYMLSELKIAFLMGFKIYLPFLVIDMVISTLLIAMGMMMLPPVLISLPFKLLLFVLVDGWALVVGGLLTSFAQPEAVAWMSPEVIDPNVVLEQLVLHGPAVRDGLLGMMMGRAG